MNALTPILTFAFLISSALVLNEINQRMTPPDPAAQAAAVALLSAVQDQGALVWIDEQSGVELLLAPGRVDACRPMDTWNVTRVSVMDGKLDGLKTPAAVTQVRARIRGSGVHLVASGPRGVRAERMIPLWTPTCTIDNFSELN